MRAIRVISLDELLRSTYTDSETLNEFTATVEFRPSRSVGEWDEGEETMEMGVIKNGHSNDLEARSASPKGAQSLTAPIHLPTDPARSWTEPMHSWTEPTRSPTDPAPQS